MENDKQDNYGEDYFPEGIERKDDADDWREDDPANRPDDTLERAAALEQLVAESDVPEQPEESQEETGRSKLKRDLKAEALTRVEEAARTVKDFKKVLGEWKSRDENRERRERYHETLRGDIPLDYGADANGFVFPRWYMDPTERQLARGNFLDYLADCPYEMHDLTGKAYLRRIVRDLNEEQKEIFFFLFLRRYSPQQLAELRGQTDRNIRKVRDTMLRKMRKKVYHELTRLKKQEYIMTMREKVFLNDYEEAGEGK